MPRKPKLTGADYLIGVAHEAAERGQPYADAFRRMVTDAFMSDGMLLAESTAQRPLREHEASPVAIVLGAYQLAANNRDRKSVDEVLDVGLSLLAKWPAYLVAFGDSHPDLQRRSDGTEGDTPSSEQQRDTSHIARPAGDRPNVCRYCDARIEPDPDAAGNYRHQ